MARIRRGFRARRRRNRILKLASGFWGRRKNVFRVAKDSVVKALVYAYRDRRNKKRSFRRLWIVRINAGARNNGVSYSRLMSALKKANVVIDRKILADLALHDPAGFTAIVEKVRQHI